MALLPAGVSTAWAQVVLPPAPGFDPGQMQERLSVPQTLPPVDATPAKPAEAPPPSTAGSDITFTLTSLTIEGATAFSQDDLRSDYQQYLGTTISLATLNDIADKITVRYRNAGYILSRAVIPQQRIEGGNVTIRVVEGYVSNVEFSGLEEGEKPGLVADMAAHITEDKPLNAKTLERYLLLMQDLPGEGARAILKPSEVEGGGADLVIAVTHKAIDATGTVDNRGTRYVGPTQFGLTASANNQLGWYERTQVHGVLTGENNELHYGQITHEEMLDSDGTKLSLSYSHTNSHPSFKLRPFDIESQDNDYSAAVSHPFQRSRTANFYTTGTIEVRETAADALGTELYQDRLRVLRVNNAYDFVDDGAAVNRISSTLSKGLGWNDDSANMRRSRGNGRPDFFKAEAQASRLQPIDSSFNFYAAASGQMSADTLLASEEFALGGTSFGSAYDPSELSGDSGAAVRAELQYNREGDWSVVPTYQLYSFWDYGKVWQRDIPGARDQPSLASAGFGLRFNADVPLSGGLEFAMPLTKYVTANGADGRAPRAFFSLMYRY